jgi:S-(hydroxymethyl)mycothiol dehydrogenase
VVFAGVPAPYATLRRPLIDFLSRGGSLKSAWYGDCLPERDSPTLISLYRLGRLPLDKFVAERIGLGGIESALYKTRAGDIQRYVVTL